MPDQNITRRLPAEWEPQDAVQLTFPHADSDWADMLDAVLPVFVQLAETISRFETVLIVCQDATATRNLLAGANTANLRFAEISSNDTWARDHGGIVIEENGRPVVLDFMFNGWGLKFPADKDNRITRALWERGFFKAEHRYPGLALEGGAAEGAVGEAGEDRPVFQGQRGTGRGRRAVPGRVGRDRADSRHFGQTPERRAGVAVPERAR